MIKKLKTQPEIMKQYDQVIKEQLEGGVAEGVQQRSSPRTRKCTLSPAQGSCETWQRYSKGESCIRCLIQGVWTKLK